MTKFENLDEAIDVESVVFFNDKVPLDKLRGMVDEYFAITSSSIEVLDDYSGEITCSGIHKASGIEKLINYLGIDKSSVIAFGDGPNDIEMLEFANIGVAMGNAVSEAKNVADRITEPIWDDGVYKEFVRLGLI